MQVNMAESMGLTDRDTSLIVVPQFHDSAPKGVRTALAA
jgi:fatty-acyl-CoA synthase